MKAYKWIRRFISIAIFVIAVSFYTETMAAEKDVKSSVLFTSPESNLSVQDTLNPAPSAGQESPFVELKQESVPPKQESPPEQGAFPQQSSAVTVQEKAALAAQKKADREADELRSKVQGYISSGDNARAMEELKGIVVSDKYKELNGWATLELYKIADKKGEIPQVTEYLDAASSKKSTNVELMGTLAEGYVRQRDWSKVVDIYEQMNKLRPKDYILQTRLTNYYVLAGLPEKAIERLEPIVKNDPNDIYHSDMLLNAYVKANMKTEALVLFRQRLQKEPGSPGLVGRYAQALMDFGMLEESLTQWQEAAMSDPRNRTFKARVDEVSGMLANSKK